MSTMLKMLMVAKLKTQPITGVLIRPSKACNQGIDGKGRLRWHLLELELLEPEKGRSATMMLAFDITDRSGIVKAVQPAALIRFCYKELEYLTEEAIAVRGPTKGYKGSSGFARAHLEKSMWTNQGEHKCNAHHPVGGTVSMLYIVKDPGSLWLILPGEPKYPKVVTNMFGPGIVSLRVRIEIADGEKGVVGRH
ncbi:hypothetical protein Tco_1237386 [Tanacetum coccineum]